MLEEPDSITNLLDNQNLGISLKQNLSAMTAFDIEYLCNSSYPFIQIVNAFGVFIDEVKINLIPASDNWLIHDYGEAVSVSATHTHKANFMLTDQLLVIAEVVALVANKKNWETIDLIAGSKTMQRLLWIETKKYNLKLSGYYPNEADEKCYERLLHNAKANSLIWEKKITPKPRIDNNIGGAE